MTTIGLVAAMPQEIRPLLPLLGPADRERLGPFTLYRFTPNEKTVVLVESGMGVQHAAAATAALIDAIKPEVIVGFGLAGGVRPGLHVGDVVVATRILLAKGRLFSEQPGLSADLATTAGERLARELGGQGFGIHAGSCITSGAIVSKRETAATLPAELSNPVLEMETAAVARVAAREGVPLLALRAVSDDAGEELGFAITDFTDKELRIRVHRVLWSVLRRPWLIPQLVRLAGNSRRAADNLARAVACVIDGL